MLIDLSGISSDEDYFRAKQTNDQMEALRLWLDENSLLAELKSLEKIQKYQRKKYDEAKLLEIKKLLTNGWNTERILHANQTAFDTEGLKFALQWAFPQAYYAVFSVLRAFFVAHGNTETSHTAIIKKYGEMVSLKYFPETISFHADGTTKNISFVNIERNDKFSSASFNRRNDDSVQHKITQFLKSTREFDLKNKKADHPKYKNMKKLNELFWRELSQSAGQTTIMSLLYRKRIKANYKDIDTFLHDDIKPVVIFEALSHIVHVQNLIHETYIIKAVGVDSYKKILTNTDIEQPKMRFKTITSEV